MSTPADVGLERWLATAKALDAEALPGLIADGAVFRSPAVHAPQEGRDTVIAYLSAALVVLGPTLTYHRTFRRETGAVLEFTARLDDREVHGVDVIEWDDDSLITDFTVLVRPVSALQKVIEHMAAELFRER